MDLLPPGWESREGLRGSSSTRTGELGDVAAVYGRIRDPETAKTAGHPRVPAVFLACGFFIAIFSRTGTACSCLVPSKPSHR